MNDKKNPQAARRDEVLKKMLKTPPKLHRDEPKRGITGRRKIKKPGDERA